MKYKQKKRIDNQKHHQQHVLARMWGKRNPSTLLVMQAAENTLEKNFGVFLKI
jgi:hypothetical protein